MGLHDASGDGEPQPGAALARREERVEHAGQDLLGHALAGVAHPDLERPGVAPRLDRDRAAGRRRLERVQHQVQHGVLQLERVGQHRLGAVLHGQRERHPLAGALGADEGHEVREEGAHGHGLERRARRAGEAQELRHEVVEAAQLAGDLADHLEDVAAAVGNDLRELLLEDPEVDLQGVQRVPHLVGDAGGDRLDERGLTSRCLVHSRSTRAGPLAHAPDSSLSRAAGGWIR